MADQYVDKDDVKNRIGLSGTGQDNNIDNAINAASRQIDAICDRRFYVDSAVNIKYYSPTNGFYLFTDDIATTTGLIVQLDTTDDGTYDTTLTLNTGSAHFSNAVEYIISSGSYMIDAGTI